MDENIKKQAIALKYDAENDSAPRVIAKGKDFVAEKILEIAQKNNIPIQTNPSLVELLNKTRLDDFIPLEAFVVVAEIIATLNMIKP